MILGCPNCGARFRVDADAVGPAGRRVRCSRCRHQWSATERDLLPDPAMRAPAPAAAAPRGARGLNVLRPKPKAAPPPPPKPKPKPAPKPVAAPPPPPPPPPPEPEPAPQSDRGPAAFGDPAEDAHAQAEAEAQAEADTPPPLPEAPAESAKAARGKAPAKKRSTLGRIAAVIGWLLFVLAVGGLAGAAYESERVMEEFPETKPVFAALGFEVPAPGDGLKLTNVTSTRVTVEGAPSLVVEGRVTNTATGRRDVPKLRGSLRDPTDRELHAWQFTASADKLAAGETATFRTEVVAPNPNATGLSITFVVPPQ